MGEGISQRRLPKTPQIPPSTQRMRTKAAVLKCSFPACKNTNVFMCSRMTSGTYCFAVGPCKGANFRRPAGSRAIRKFTVLLHIPHTPSKNTTQSGAVASRSDASNPAGCSTDDGDMTKPKSEVTRQRRKNFLGPNSDERKIGRTKLLRLTPQRTHPILNLRHSRQKFTHRGLNSKRILGSVAIQSFANTSA